MLCEIFEKVKHLNPVSVNFFSRQVVTDFLPPHCATETAVTSMFRACDIQPTRAACIIAPFSLWHQLPQNSCLLPFDDNCVSDAEKIIALNIVPNSLPIEAYLY